jgi:hypothetical protein
MPRRAVAILTTFGLVVLALSIGLLAGVYLGVLAGVGVGGAAVGIAALVLSWLVEQT